MFFVYAVFMSLNLHNIAWCWWIISSGEPKYININMFKITSSWYLNINPTVTANSYDLRSINQLICYRRSKINGTVNLIDGSKIVWNPFLQFACGPPDRKQRNGKLPNYQITNHQFYQVSFVYIPCPSHCFPIEKTGRQDFPQMIAWPSSNQDIKVDK